MENKKKDKRVIQIVRRVVQVVCFIFLPSLFIQIFASIKAIFMLAILGQGTLATIAPDIMLLAVATAVTAVAGRFFCGWMCAFGSMSDFLYKVPRLFTKNSAQHLKGADRYLKFVKYFILAAVVLLVWCLQLVSIPSGVSPWDLFGVLSSFGNWPSLSVLLATWVPAMIILAAIMVASVFIERFFCRYLCPLGAYFAIVSRIRPLFIRKERSNCGKCSLCSKKCAMGIELGTMDKIHTGECIDCMECAVCCPAGNAHLEMSEKSRNALVAGTLSCTLVAGSYFLGNFYTDSLSTASTGSSYAISETAASSSIAANIADGTYTGSGSGYRGTTTVSVTVSGGLIQGVTVESSGDDDEYLSRASSTVISEIISEQSTDVDTVSGATYSSNGILSAVADALGTDYTPVQVSESAGHGGGHRQ